MSKLIVNGISKASVILVIQALCTHSYYNYFTFGPIEISVLLSRNFREGYFT
jgi:hypothetical protein